MTNFTNMIRAAAILGVAAFSAGNAGAIIINFNDFNSCFTTPANGNTCTSVTDDSRVFMNANGDKAMLVYNQSSGVADSSNGQVVNIGYGTFVWTYTPNTLGHTPAQVLIAPFNFNLVISTTAPTVSTFPTLFATVSGPSGLGGGIGANFSNMQISFSNTFTNVGPITFDVFPGIQLLADPSTNGGQTTIQGQVQDTAIPEPTTAFLFGGGLLAISGLLSRRGARTRA